MAEDYNFKNYQYLGGGGGGGVMLGQLEGGGGGGGEGDPVDIQLVPRMKSSI